MKKKLVSMLSVGCCLLVGGGFGTTAYADATGPDSSPLVTGVTDSGVAAGKTGNPMTLQKGGMALESALQKLHVAGGISAGEFYTSNPGLDTSGNEVLLSNFLFELSNGDNDQPIGFEAAVGSTTTPSLLSTPDTTANLDLEYASVSLNAIKDTSIEVGLLKPDSGFEDTYTYNNANVVLGALASQQPYNAYGAKVEYAVNGINLNAAYYGKRLDESEYAVNGETLGHAWEAGIGTTFNDVSYKLYHYHMARIKNLTGALIEHTYQNIYFALNVDWWQWNKAMDNYYGSRSSIGGAFYVVPSFGKFSFPVRVEYIDQGSSRMYLENQDTKKICSATISPTYRFTDESYLRLESSYVHAAKGFADKDGQTKNSRVYLAAEIGYVF